MMKIIDQRETQKKKTEKNKGAKVTAKLFCCAFRLSFLQIICKAYWILKPNLGLALSIILKEKELYDSKHVAVESRCLKICDLLSFLKCFSILILK